MPVVRLKKNRERTMLHRHPWVFSGAVQSVEGDPAAGDVVTVVDSAGIFLARGYYNGRSSIRVRVLEWGEDRAIDESWWRERITAAVERRASLAAAEQTDAYRLVHAEADFLPGLVVDRYGDYVVVQFLTAGVERVRDIIIDALSDVLNPAAVFDRSDDKTREKEGLKPSTGVLKGTPPEGPLNIVENGLRFLVDFNTGQKTGFYLDQRDNRRVVAGYAAGRRVLDAFSYTGAFSVYAGSAGAAALTLVESSVTAVELAGKNLELNRVPTDNVEIIRGDVFERLRAFRDEGRRFDLVILDPPKFARTKTQAEQALRGYKDINLSAMKILEPGGLLATFSCSGGVDAEAFGMAVSWAGLDAGRDVQILKKLGQPEDHPILATFAESEYLKGLVCRVL